MHIINAATAAAEKLCKVAYFFMLRLILPIAKEVANICV
jgi:hypothetical protein